jgi:hypothetical protein
MYVGDHLRGRSEISFFVDESKGEIIDLAFLRPAGYERNDSAPVGRASWLSLP